MTREEFVTTAIREYRRQAPVPLNFPDPERFAEAVAGLPLQGLGLNPGRPGEAGLVFSVALTVQDVCRIVNLLHPVQVAPLPTAEAGVPVFGLWMTWQLG